MKKNYDGINFTKGGFLDSLVKKQHSKNNAKMLWQCKYRFELVFNTKVEAAEFYDIEL
jgi:hypothetical protein